MLRWLLVLAMALLPWHGWAGASPDARLATAVQPAVVGAATQEAHHRADGADCLEHAGADVDHHAAAGADDGCPGCSMCHSCSPVALPATTGVPSADRVPPQHRAGPEAQFASADRDPGLKPPIS